MPNRPDAHAAGNAHDAPHISPQDFNALLRHEAHVIKDVVQMAQKDFDLASHGSLQSAAALSGDAKALQMNLQAFVQLDQDIQHHAAYSVLAHDYQAVQAAEHFTVPLAAGGVGPVSDLMAEYAQIDHILNHDFFLA